MTDDAARAPRRLSLVEALAFAGLAVLVLVVPMVREGYRISSVRIDSTIVTTALAVLLALPLLVRNGVRALPRYGIEAPALVFLAIAGVSVFASEAPLDSMLTLVRYVVYVLLVFLVGMVARDDAMRRWLMWLIAFSALLTTVVSYLQLLYPPDVLSVPGMRGLPSTVATRITGTFGNSNFYAEFLVLALGVVLALVLTERGTLKFVAIVLFADIVLALLFTYTRGSWLAAVAGIALALAMTKPRALWLFFAAMAAAVLAVPGALERLQSVGSAEGTASFRLRLWQVTGAIIAEHPFIGVGVGQFLTGFRKVMVQRADLNVGYLEYGAHNSYFTLAAETGPLGGLAFLWLAFAVVRQGLFLGRRDTDDAQFLLANAGLTAALAGLTLNAFTSNVFQHPQVAVFFFVVAGLQAGLGARHWEAPARSPRAAWQPRARVLAPSLVGRALAAVSRFVSGAWRGSDLRRVLERQAAFDGVLLRSSILTRPVRKGARS